MVLSEQDIKQCLDELKIESQGLNNITLKQISSAFQKLALKLHPDKAGESSTAAFQKLLHAYEKICRELIVQSGNDTLQETSFFDDNFEAFNFPFENQGSFTVKIEKVLATAWNDCISQRLGIPQIKSNKKGTETDRFWKTNYTYNETVIDITIHLYINSTNKKDSKGCLQK